MIYKYKCAKVIERTCVFAWLRNVKEQQWHGMKDTHWADNTSLHL